MEEDRSENRDRCYYPGCRKDANCNCEICLASNNATLDLMPIRVQKSSLTKLSSLRPNVKSTPISFDASILSTPRSSSCPIRSSPILKSTARFSVRQKNERTKKKIGFLGKVLEIGIGFELDIFCSFWDFPTCYDIGCDKKCWREILGSARIELGFKYGNSVWAIKKDGLLLNSRCTLYKSATEEVSIWGWPLQTAGLLTTGFSCRSFNILSGRVTEWPDGQVGYVIRKANTSWVHQKWDASVVQLDANTWIIEYQRSSILDNSRLYSAAMQFMKHRISRMAKG